MGRKTEFTKMSVLLKFLYKLNRILIKILASFFLELDKLILKFIWKSKGSAITIRVLKTFDRGEFSLLDIKTWHRILVIKAVLFWLQGRQIDQQTEKLGIDSHTETLAMRQAAHPRKGRQSSSINDATAIGYGDDVIKSTSHSIWRSLYLTKP